MNILFVNQRGEVSFQYIWAFSQRQFITSLVLSMVILLNITRAKDDNRRSVYVVWHFNRHIRYDFSNTLADSVRDYSFFFGVKRLNFNRINVKFLCIFAIERKWVQGTQFKKDHIHLSGKVIIITGCNSGIGKETAIDLARRGAKIYMACRDKDRAEAAQNDIMNAANNRKVVFFQCDLASFESVRSFVRL